MESSMEEMVEMTGKTEDVDLAAVRAELGWICDRADGFHRDGIIQTWKRFRWPRRCWRAWNR